jgi:hypothetical protein
MSENDRKGPGRPPEFRLAAQEKAYLETGDTGENISSRLEDSIEDKVDRLPDRFETLLEDTKRLGGAGRLEGEQWEEGLTRLLNIQDRDLYEKTGRDGVPYEFDLSPRRFGERLGRMVDRLMLYSSDSPIVRIQTELAWGFINGVCLGETKFWGGGDSTQREAVMELVIDNVVEQYERRKKEKEGRAKSMRSYSAESDEANRKIRTILENEGIDPPMWLVLRIQNDIRGFQRMSSDAESSFAEKFTSETVRAAYKDDRLPEKHRVIESFRNDRDHLRSIEWDNLVAASVIEHIPIDEGLSTRSLSEQVDSDNLSTLAKVGTYLAGEDELRGEGRIERPIIDLQREEGELYTEWIWKFTTYGRGLKCYMQLPESILQSPFDDIFSYDAIEAASEELTECDREAY